MKTIGHHTCANNNNENDILKKAPFLSVMRDRKCPFLGNGYYYWDNNIDVAKWWGKEHYDDKFYVIESNLDLSNETFWDLVGNRANIIIFKLFLEKLKEILGQEITIGKSIYRFKKFILQEKNINISAIRAFDHRENSKQKKYFFSDTIQFHFTNLNPCYIICISQDSKSKIILNNVIAFKK